MLGRHVLRGTNMPGRNVCAVLLCVMKMLGRHFFPVALGVTTNILGRNVLCVTKMLENICAVVHCVTNSNMLGRHVLRVTKMLGSNVLAVLFCGTNMLGRQLLAVALRVCFCRDHGFRVHFLV
jgi:hypothetical protein